MRNKPEEDSEGPHYIFLTVCIVLFYIGIMNCEWDDGNSENAFKSFLLTYALVVGIGLFDGPFVTKGLHTLHFASALLMFHAFFEAPVYDTYWYLFWHYALLLRGLWYLYTIYANYNYINMDSQSVPDITCRRCGDVVGRQDSFCKKCGEKIPDEQFDEPVAPLVEESKKMVAQCTNCLKILPPETVSCFRCASPVRIIEAPASLHD